MHNLSGHQAAPLELAIRAYAVPEVASSPYEAPALTRRHPDTLLVFDTETTLDAAQRLTFGSARLYRPRDTSFGSDFIGSSRFECFAEFLIYGDSVTEADVAVIDDYVASFPVVEYHGQYWDQTTRSFRHGVVPSRIAEDGVPISVRSRADFVRYAFMPMATRARCLVIGFNLPFDLARLAYDWTDLRRHRRRRDERGELPSREKPWDAFEGGFGLMLAQKARSDEEDTRRPRIAVKTIDAKRHLIQFRGGGTEEETDASSPGSTDGKTFRGHFLDLRTLAFALTNESHSLASACKTFETEHGKDKHEPTGMVTHEELTYGRHDTRATFELADALLSEYARHPVSPDHPGTLRMAKPLQVTRAYSPASVGKAYLGAMGITPPLTRWPDFPRHVVAKAMTAFYGGRAECRIRRIPLPVRYVDFTSMYPTVNGLMGLWEILTARRLDVVDVTSDVVALVGSLTVDVAFEPAFWTRLRVLVEVEPIGDILPTRAAYEGAGVGWQIGVNPLTAGRPLWYALPDVVAATLLSGRPPVIRSALRLVPSGKLTSLRETALRGEVSVDPAIDDFFAAVIERRSALADRDGADKPLSDFLKVLANATSYGIFAEMIRHELPAKERLPVKIQGLGEPYVERINTPEEPGAYCFPPLAALITSAARLMLAILERCVVEAGGAYVMVDTDSMAIVSTRDGRLLPCPGGDQQLGGVPAVQALSWAAVDEIRARFDALNPYRTGAVKDLIKVEDHNFTLAPTPENPNAVDRTRPLQLHAFAISAKRYALFNMREDGTVELRKPSEHGLGHLLNPDDPDETTRAWIPRAWRNLVADAHGERTKPLGIEQRPAVSRITAGSMSLLAPFTTYNQGKSADERVRPFNFLLSANIRRLGHPPGVDPHRFHLVSRYERDPAKWSRMRWIDRYSRPPRTYPITTGPAVGDLVGVKSIAEVLQQYRTHPEPKSLGPNGDVCQGDTVGLLGRRPVHASSFVYIGKEANELDEVEEGLVHELAEVVNNYGEVRDAWVTHIVPALREIPSGWLAKRCSVNRRTIQRVKRGAVPRPALRACLQDALRDWAHRLAQQYEGRP